ncbi:(Fe-S)-binding protein [Paraburkholderia silvatlantica]|uniref:L-lactate dehydrogenase complex protein LldE n=1 Tax=Paraburkholderia silvatlantica TaxID=321895 RepID=A0A2U1AGH2_9BURK|nr:(Fe-S)-binding protein [Paraburkholderia silvatlantica]MBB2928914.1 L-lactate dehydrogenase complex protein LldE [Paraburkholderia silvatlantica]PVY35496.1 L-lactate dehydrogenase complex protein LldE [Paraburkholderia silvatlantica]PXW41138.1 L-lactate dehydrogenase complex protein LldE [Paraburkholderia silvatlantica]PYE27604.1 L-lactate dehydrogenase complex protein LldE [Paraburkholderia silvatlantica]TDQ98035.1 L-lactate dehydrogenase complex protein LldE [Paraburkholderia silvatlantic
MKPRQYPTERPTDVYLFATCLVDLFVPQAGLDAVKLLEREGLTVHFPRGQSCCGQPAYSSGNPRQAREVALAQLELFDKPWPVIVPSGSCAGMMRHHWPALFDGDAANAARAEGLSARVYELTEFLVRVLNVDFNAYGANGSVRQPEERVVLHTSCGARREMGTRVHGVEVVDALPGVTRIEHEREPECCGFGGTFSLKHPDISGAMVADKIASACATGCERLVSADCGCLLNIGHAAAHKGAPLAVEHLASFLWRRTGGEAA